MGGKDARWWRCEVAILLPVALYPFRTLANNTVERRKVIVLHEILQLRFDE